MTYEISQVAIYGLTTLTITKLFTSVWLFGEVIIVTLLFTVRSRKLMRISLPGGVNVDNASRTRSLHVLSLFSLLASARLVLCLIMGQ
ncbi:hypothetical protein Xmau_02994 [Xenorhabdus mauleonii]|uniref:Uncharacterized protein n=1 Tax=Xenorhabdus mauleonii TaxID=351675 RepID=A0A1I3S960_9GAMM|nr:hypothetical protein Xmau_02994 [Xenorhabdus mauleonii]SFJ54940.1 hypothetical protein SAMN05421680_11115 [Xenorhabdus mauleonii]